jgi:(S)-mandelate dehydrogenase
VKLSRIVSIDDLRNAARRELPKIIFDFIEGGVDNEQCLMTNAGIGPAHQIVPRYFGDVGTLDQSVTLMGRTYASPFGIGPTGLSGLFRPGADLMLARGAAEAEIPFALSTASNATLEEVAQAAGDYAWFQLYGARDRAISADMIRRADAAGIRTLMVTVDTPVSSKRERNMRNGFSRPLRMRPEIFLESLLHPRWIWRYLKDGGTPVFGNWVPYAAPGASKDDVAAFSTTQTPNRQTWADLETTRKLWPHTLVVKGVMHPDDAVRAVEIGADGVIVSNHGGRVLDRAPSTFAVFPFVRDAVAGRAAVMLDSGITRGSDILTAYCLGADFVFVGRATLYGAVVGGDAGVQRAIEILRQEVNILLGQIGCATPKELGPQFLFPSLAKAPA